MTVILTANSDALEEKMSLPVPLCPPQLAHAPALTNGLSPETAKRHGGK
jgi:hypothetical protein